jgi:predicted ATPase
VPQLDYEQLYAYLTRHAKQYLGLMKGYKVVLEVERCSGLQELQDYARRFVEMVREAQGDDLADQVRRAMGMH